MTIQLLRDDARAYQEVTQKVGEKLVYGTDWTDRITRFWSPNTLIAANTAIRVRPATGFQYTTVAGGQTAQNPPVWPVIIGATVQDGAVTWVCEAIDTTSLLRTPSTQVWTPDSGMISSAASLAGNVTSALIDSTGATEGNDYYVRNFVTMSDGSVEVATWKFFLRSFAT